MLRIFVTHVLLFDCEANTYAAHPAGGGVLELE
jgi:hypothetical protein